MGDHHWCTWSHLRGVSLPVLMTIAPEWLVIVTGRSGRPIQPRRFLGPSSISYVNGSVTRDNLRRAVHRPERCQCISYRTQTPCLAVTVDCHRSRPAEMRSIELEFESPGVPRSDELVRPHRSWARRPHPLQIVRQPRTRTSSSSVRYCPPVTCSVRSPVL
jgi:hypothetical protein